MSTNGESPAPEAAGDSRDPSGFLSEIIGAPVTVKLNSGIVYKGTSSRPRKCPASNSSSSGDLQSVDGYMNIALERCKEVAEGRVIRSWGDAFVRGNNGRHLNLQTSTPTDFPAVTYICADNA
jgi:U6 snRNA-associated Sm-like protein LSm6